MNKSVKLAHVDSNINRYEEDEENLSDYEKQFKTMRADKNSRLHDDRSLEGGRRTLNNT